jgi:OmpA-OmpF porin, OOP family
MKRVAMAVLAGGMLGAGAPASAQGVFEGLTNLSGVYIGAGAGWNWRESAGDSFAGRPGNTDLDFNDGWVGVLALGYRTRLGARLELEGNFRDNTLDYETAGGLGRFGAGGRARTYGAMVNALWDLNFNLPLAIVPYVGGGIGYAHTEYSNVRSSAPDAPRIDGGCGAFAYQGIAGAGMPVLGVPGLLLTAEYRYFNTLECKIDGQAGTGGALRRDGFEQQSEFHSALIGLRYTFGTPARRVAETPAAAPAPARTFLVFFDWDRSDLTARAREIIGEAAQGARRGQPTRIEVAGHADRTGTAQYNQRLSERRAEAVAAELVRNGINRADITTTGFGFERPLVPTAAGVREPQNRRVEIVLR